MIKFLISLLFVIPIYSNSVGYSRLVDGKPILKKGYKIQLVQEDIHFNLKEKFTIITVNYKFYNSEDKSRTLKIAFPYLTDRSQNPAYKEYVPKDFLFIVNNIKKKINYTSHKVNDSTNTKTFYALTKAHFPKLSFTYITVRYEINHSISLPLIDGAENQFLLTSYIFGTANLWYKKIKKFSISISNPNHYWIYNLEPKHQFPIKKLNAKKVNFTKIDFKPTSLTQSVEIYFSIKPIFYKDFSFERLKNEYNYEAHIRALLFLVKERSETKIEYLNKNQIEIFKQFIYYMNGKKINEKNLKYFKQFEEFRKVKPEFLKEEIELLKSLNND
ncbi:MAG: hypothetical protein SFU98_14865 [Leptospiraceae bacterium]|nr:hypothetical protein [Leptospiraceae bacterium]